MKIKQLIYLIFISLMLNSCLFEDNSKQEYPQFDFQKTREIQIQKVFDDSYLRTIKEKEKINQFATFFIDSTNYFKNEKYQYNGKRAIYHLIFYSGLDTLQLTIYPEINKNKTEIGFFGKTLSNHEDEYIGTKFHRFFINRKILNLIEQED